jgi:hypothetical protein
MPTASSSAPSTIGASTARDANSSPLVLAPGADRAWETGVGGSTLSAVGASLALARALAVAVAAARTAAPSPAPALRSAPASASASALAPAPAATAALVSRLRATRYDTGNFWYEQWAYNIPSYKTLVCQLVFGKLAVEVENNWINQI